ncbi:MAG: hypothetical protein FWB97_01155 [Oscillospiraceae bacterium]|nr:hypothetical protein [Oscillospiraceae bacterium]
MAHTEYKQGDIICKKGSPLTSLSLITSGDVDASFFGHTIILSKADVIGLCDIVARSHNHTYTALTDVKVYENPIEDFDAIEAVMQTNADMAHVMVTSICTQLVEFLGHVQTLKNEAGSTHAIAQKLHAEYVSLCEAYAFTPKQLMGISEIAAVPNSNQIDSWVHPFYAEVRDLDPKVHRQFFFGHPGISYGFFRRCAALHAQVYNACNDYYNYIIEISKFLLDEGGHDLFSMFSELHINSLNIAGAAKAVEALIEPLIGHLSEMTCISHELFQRRLDSYGEGLSAKQVAKEADSDSASAPGGSSTPGASGTSTNLKDSMSEILRYSGCPPELCSKFVQGVQAYTKLTDRRSSDDEVYDLRKLLTSSFYEIYYQIVLKTLEDPTPPTSVKMFLAFGYVDPELAGQENAQYLYSIVDSVKGDPKNGIYTIHEWLLAVYNGDVEPSLSEFELDYPGYVKELKQSQKIDAKEEARLLKDQSEKLKFEMENVFPVVNRVTYGKPTTFVPLFADHNVTRYIQDTFVSTAQVKKSLDEIRSVDFSAFYRETAYTNPKIGIPNENVNVEVLPNIILMPNLGMRGSMWQEIEGRLRTTPARMFMPMFYEDDVKGLVIRLVGEFRWEMCKRVQGSRWNDISDPSLTSIFSDYLQFYMNNRNLSMQTMLAIRNEISSARNNYKAVFVNNYTDWLLHESRGAARLNNVAIGVLMTFCPFTEPIRESLTTNLRYSEALNRYKAKQNKRVQYLMRLAQKVKQSGKDFPQELADELEYTKR